VIKADAYPMLKTIVLNLQNGRSLPQALGQLCENSTKKRERKAYEKIRESLRQGESFSTSLEHYCLCPKEVISFVAMAEKGLYFNQALAKVVEYIEVKDSFKEESSDKLTMPSIYFFLAVVVICGIHFIALPMQFSNAQAYSAEVLSLIEKHLEFAKVMSMGLVISLGIVAFYFFVTILALFSRDRILYNMSAIVVRYLPFSRKIVLRFEKFMVFTILSQMLHSGIGFKKSIEAIISSGDMKFFQQSFSKMLSQMKIDGFLAYPKEIFDANERSLLQGVGSNNQMASMLFSLASRNKTEAMNLSKRFFRYITLSAILLMAFAVFIEFYVVVLTQVILQKGLIDLGNSGAAF